MCLALGQNWRLLCALFCLAVSLAGMGLVRAELPAITEGEYFFNDDPGYGNGTTIIFDTESASFELEWNAFVAGVELPQPGLHQLSYRFKDENGAWSHTVSHLIVVEDITPLDNLSEIILGEYFFDSDPGYGNGISFPVEANTALELLPLLPPDKLPSDGLHVLSFRFKSHAGDWSQTETVAILMSSSSPNDPVVEVVAAEFFWNEDPGLGQATSLNFTASPQLSFSSTLETTSLPVGHNLLGLRFQDAQGRWSHTVTQRIFQEDRSSLDPLLSLASLKVFLNDSNEPHLELSYESVTEFEEERLQIDLSAVPLGRHQIQFMVTDVLGQESQRDFVNIQLVPRTSRESLPALVSLRYRLFDPSGVIRVEDSLNPSQQGKNLSLAFSDLPLNVEYTIEFYAEDELGQGAFPFGKAFLQASETDRWLSEYFTQEELANPEISGLLADPDGDGLNNLLELAFFTHPRLPNASPISVALSPQGNLQIRYPQRTGGSGQTGVDYTVGDVTVAVAVGTSLAPYDLEVDAELVQHIPAATLDNGNGTETVTVERVEPIAPEEVAAFLQVQATHVPPAPLGPPPVP